MENDECFCCSFKTSPHSKFNSSKNNRKRQNRRTTIRGEMKGFCVVIKIKMELTGITKGLKQKIICVIFPSVFPTICYSILLPVKGRLHRDFYR